MAALVEAMELILGERVVEVVVLADETNHQTGDFHSFVSRLCTTQTARLKLLLRSFSSLYTQFVT